MLFTLIYRANPGDKSNTGNRSEVFYCPNVAAAERRAEAILMERDVWDDRGAQLWSDQGDDEHIASLHSLLPPSPWVRPKPVPGVTERVLSFAFGFEGNGKDFIPGPRQPQKDDRPRSSSEP